MKFNSFQKLTFLEEKQKNAGFFKTLGLDSMHLSTEDVSGLDCEELEVFRVQISGTSKLSNLKVGSGVLSELEWKALRISQTNFCNTRIHRVFGVESVFDLVFLENCELVNSDFRNARFVYSSLQDVSSRQSDFSFSQWKSTRFVRSAIFVENIWSQSVFWGCSFDEIDFSEAEALNFNNFHHCQFHACHFRADQKASLEPSNSVVSTRKTIPLKKISNAPEKVPTPEQSLKSLPPKEGRFSALELGEMKELKNV